MVSAVTGTRAETCFAETLRAMPDALIYRRNPRLTRSGDGCGPSKDNSYRLRSARTIAVFAAGIALCACSFPVTVPLGPVAENGDAEIITGSIGTGDNDVEEQGMVDRLGAQTWAALRGAVVSAAEYGEDGQAFGWRDDRDGIEGTVTAVDAFFDEDGVVCRRMAITAIAYSNENSLIADACQKADGGWSVRPSPETEG